MNNAVEDAYKATGKTYQEADRVIGSAPDKSKSPSRRRWPSTGRR